MKKWRHSWVELDTVSSVHFIFCALQFTFHFISASSIEHDDENSNNDDTNVEPYCTELETETDII